MEIIFENEEGRVQFSRVGRGDWRLLEVTGLGLAPKSFETVRYAGEAGQKTLSVTPGARTITLSAEVSARDRFSRSAITSKAFKVLNKEGVLRIRGLHERVIKCRASDISEGERHGGSYRVFAIQFVCDSPYFTDSADNVVRLYQRKDLLYDGFVIGDGIVLTERIAGGKILNDGDEETRGVLRLETAGSGEGKVIITNETTGGSVKLNVTAGETYIIDFEERTIENADGADMISVLDDMSYLSDFYLVRGENKISAETVGGDDVSLAARLTYRRKYVEAID